MVEAVLKSSRIWTNHSVLGKSQQASVKGNPASLTCQTSAKLSTRVWIKGIKWTEFLWILKMLD